MNDSKDSSNVADLSAQLATLTQAAGVVQLSQRSFVSLTGDDRQAFLNNFCTNDTKKLVAGEVCEAFVLNTKGKLLGFVHVIAGEGELLLTGHGEQAPALIEHLDKYLIREDVEMSDHSKQLGAVLVCGPEAAGRLSSQIGGELPELNHFSECELNSIKFRLVHAEFAGTGYLLICDASSVDDLKTCLAKADIAECSAESLEIVRINAKTPWFGIDADESNLPQELQRDEKAISFNKGCYLGQETVARIDARGRVNQLLVRFKFTGDSIPPLGEFSHEEKTAGRITSFAQFPASSAKPAHYIAMGYVRRQFRDPGTELGDWVVLKEST